MAISDALAWRLNNGGTAADLYADINNFLATNPTAEQTQAAMAQYGISPQDVAAATGGTSGGLLGGNILAGASWNSLNTTLPEQLKAVTGQETTNTAVGGATTADTLKQLNTFLAGGGQFDPNATVFLQTGGVDFLQGVDKGTIKDNINQIVKTLGDQGVNVVLTGSPYAASIQDVINNKFDPKVDPLFNDIAKENKNVALVNTQGEILQNKGLLVDALHTNAEGTAIYNQSVIDALSQFKNEVPASTPQAISQVQKTGVIPTTRGTVIEGDNIDQQIAGIPQVVYETRVDPNNPANWQTYNPKTGEVIKSGTFAGGGDQGLLRAAAPVVGLAASTIGLPFITSALSGLTGATGSTLAGLTGATIGAGSQAVTGGSGSDILRGGLLGGAGGYLGSELQNAMYDSTAAADLAAGLDPRYGGANPLYGTKYDAAMSELLDQMSQPVAVSTPVVDAGGVTITAPTTAALNAGMLGSLVTPSTVANAGTVNVTGQSTPQQVDQAVIDLINSQLTTKGTTTPTQTITGVKPTSTTQDIVSAITAALPTVTPTQAATIAEQVITSGKPVTNQEVINTIAATLPSVLSPTTTVPNVTVTATKPTTVGDTLATFPSTLVNVPTTTTPTTTTTTDNKDNTLGLTNDQILNILKGGIGLLGGLGAGSLISGGGTSTVNPSGLPTQAPPMYTDDYFTKVQQNYNQLLPAVPRDVATPLRDWYTSKYGA